MDQFITALLVAGKGALELTGSVSPMLIGAKEGTERVAIQLPLSDTETSLLRYVQAVMLCLMAGSDTIYELRDVFASKADEVTEDTVPPHLDPEATNALLIIQAEIADPPSEDSFILPYGIGDQGQPIFEQVEPGGSGLYGAYHTAFKQTIEQWTISGKQLITREQAEHVLNRTGLLGRISF